MTTHVFSVFVVGRKILDSGESRDVIAVGEMQAHLQPHEVHFDKMKTKYIYSQDYWLIVYSIGWLLLSCHTPTLQPHP